MYEQQFDEQTVGVLAGIDPARLAIYAIDRLAERDAAAVPVEALGERVADLVTLAERAQAAALPALGRFHTERGCYRSAHRSTGQWLARTAPIRVGAAHALVLAARVAHDHPLVADAVAEGRISVDHTAMLGRAAAGVRGALFARDVEHLVAVAASLPLDAFAKALAHWEQLCDDELAREDAQLRYQQRHVSLGTTFDGSGALKGTLEPAGAAIVRRALDLLMPPDPADTAGGPRTPGQRAHDALVEMAQRVLDHANPTGRNPTAMVDVIVDAELLARARAHQAGHPPIVNGLPDLRHVRCDVDGTPVPLVTVHTLLADAGVGWIVTNGRSEPLDVGRTQRLFTAAQRRALRAQYGTCALGCGQPATTCRIHHIAEWDRDQGPTDLANGVPLCTHHHHFIHLNGWQPVRLPDGRITYEPPDPPPAGSLGDRCTRDAHWPPGWRPPTWQPPPGAGFATRDDHHDDPAHQRARDRAHALRRHGNTPTPA